MTHSLKHLFEPRSVAIIGISRSTPSLGRMILDNMVDSGYDGKIYLVNPKAEEIASYPVYNSIESLPTPIDVAVILTPPRFVAGVIDELGTKSCKFVSIITAGFDDNTTNEIIQAATMQNVRIVGPNSMGTYGKNAHVSFSPIPIAEGSIGFISQSGSIVAVAQECLTSTFGFSKFISLGNKIDITELDALEFMAQDPSTKVIVCYLESFANPQKLRSVLSSITPLKPVIVVKGGRTELGSRAVSSHTGALAGNFRLTSSLLKQCGVMLVPTIEKAIDLARFISRFGVSHHTGIVTISSAGGPGVLAADEIVEAGLTLAQLQSNTINQLKEVIPPFGNAHNPLDLVADAGIDRYMDTLEIVKDDPGVTTFLVIIVHPVLIDTKPLLDALNTKGVHIICAYLGPEFANYDTYDNLILYQRTADVIDILQKIDQYVSWKEKASDYFDHSHITQLFENPKIEKIKEVDVIELLESYDFIYPKSLTTTSFDEAKIWFEVNQRPVVAKLDHPQFSHKTDSGGVILNIQSLEQLEEAWKNIDCIYQQHSIPVDERRVEVQPFYSDGLELVLGCIKDEQFGHFILIGAGGTLVELLDDTVFLPSPLSAFAVREAIQNLDFYKLLSGYRGSKPVDMDQLVNYILKFDQLVVDHPEIMELDINPLYIIAETKEFVVLDARIELE